MFRSLFGRNFTLLVVLVLMAQLVAGVAVSAFVIRPQLSRATSIVADMLDNLSVTLDAVPPDSRGAVIDHYAQQQSVIILPEGTDPGGESQRPRLLERVYLNMLTERLRGQDAMIWRLDDNSLLWLRLKLGGDHYWMALESPRVWTPFTTLSLVILITLLAATLAGFLVQKRLSAPLERVARAADAFDPQKPTEHLPEDGATEIAQLSASFNRMGERLGAVEREREIMLAGISHDLRTPLAKLRLSLAMMKGEDKDLLEGCDRQVDTIDVMLGQFFDFARGFKDELVAERPLAEVLAEAVARADGKGVVAVDCAADLALQIRAEALTRGVGNLIRNALVHGTPPIRVSASRTDAGVEIRVTDAGPGFPASDEARLTNPFVRGNEARSSAGSGLGLSIAQRAALAHGGSLRFERSKGFSAVMTIQSSSRKTPPRGSASER